MDNGQMARWVARVEHIARIEAEKRNEQFRRDIRPDDLDMVSSSDVQPAGGLWSSFKQSLTGLSIWLGIKRGSQLPQPRAGYKQHSVKG